MDEKAIIECGVCFFQGTAERFTPTSVCADFDAPECPRCRNNDPKWFEELKKPGAATAA